MFQPLSAKALIRPFATAATPGKDNAEPDDTAPDEDDTLALAMADSAEDHDEEADDEEGDVEAREEDGEEDEEEEEEDPLDELSAADKEKLLEDMAIVRSTLNKVHYLSSLLYIQHKCHNPSQIRKLSFAVIHPTGIALPA